MLNKKNTDDSQNKISEKINYEIKTMESDLNNKKPSSDTFTFGEKALTEKTPKKELFSKKPTPIKEKPEIKIANPFLEDLNSKEDSPVIKPLNKIQKKNTEKTISTLRNEAFKKNLLETKKPISSFPKPHQTTNKEDILISQKKIPINSFDKVKHLSRKTNKINKGLLISLFLVLLLSLGAGVYYFYSINPDISPTPKPQNPIKEQPELINKLASYTTLELAEETLPELILANKELLLANSTAYYKTNKNNQELTSAELLTQLGIVLPENITNQLGSSWIFNYRQEETLKMGLIFEINQSTDELLNYLRENETSFPELFKSILIDENSEAIHQPVVFQDSLITEGVRFYNFTEKDNTKSIDWGIINNQYLTITTSQDSTLKLTEDLVFTEKKIIENSLKNQ